MKHWIDFLTPYLDKKDNRIWNILLQNPRFPVSLVEYYMDEIIAYEKEQIQKFGEKTVSPYIWGIWGLSSNITLTPQFIHKYHHKLHWGELGLSRNPAMTPALIDMYLPENKPFDWKWNGLSRNPSITLEFIQRHLDKPWIWGKGGLSRHPCITPEFVEEFIEEFPWDWGNEGLSSNPSMTPEFIERNIHRPWAFSIYMPNGLHEPDYELMKYNHIHHPHYMNNAHGSDIRKDIGHEIGYDMDEHTECIDKEEPFGLCYYMKHPDFFKPEWIERMQNTYGIVWDWSYTGFSSNPHIPFEFFKYFIQPSYAHFHLVKWTFGHEGLSSNHAFTPLFLYELIQSQPTKLKHIEIGMLGLSANPSFHVDFIDQLLSIYQEVIHPFVERKCFEHDMYKQMYTITLMNMMNMMNVNTIQLSLLHIRLFVNSLEWGWSGLSSNSSVTIDFIQKHKDKRWNWGADGLSSNSGIDYTFVQTFKDKPWEYIKNITFGSVFENPSLFK
jgi:hypothetical protein